MRVTKADLARELGISKARVSQYIGMGMPAGPDGKIDREEALSWVKSRVALTPGSDKGPGRAQRLSGKPKPVRTPAEAREAVSLVRQVLVEEGAASEGEVDLNMVRVAEGILKSRERDLKIAERRKQLVPLEKVKAHVSKAFVGFRQAVQLIPARHAGEMAAALGCDPGQLQGLLSKAINQTLAELSAPVVRT